MKTGRGNQRGKFFNQIERFENQVSGSIPPAALQAIACTVDEAMALMTEKRIRHLPVVDSERVIGVVSIGDPVKHIIDEQAATIGHLHA